MTQKLPEKTGKEQFPSFVTRERYLEIRGRPSFEEYYSFYKERLFQCIEIEKSLPFWIGDFCNYGEKAYGEKYSQAMEVTHYSLGTLMNYCYTCRNVPPENRNPKLGINVHYQVARLPRGDQVEVLAQAAEKNWSSLETRAAAQKVLPSGPRTKKPSTFRSFYVDYCSDNIDASGNVTEKHMSAAFNAGLKAGRGE